MSIFLCTTFYKGIHSQLLIYITSIWMLFTLTGTCSDPQPHPPTFYKHYGDLAPEVESYLEGVCARWHAQSLCSF